RQRLEEEMNIGRRIQLSLLPEVCPEIAGWDFAAYYQAARQVGGDLYDYFDRPDGRLGIVIADITGKGIPAALFMGVCRAIIRHQALSADSPAQALVSANRAVIYENRMTVPLSAFYAILDPRSGALTFANGGHDFPFLLRAATRTIDTLQTRSFLLGAFDDIQLEEGQTVMQAGDMLVLYTDGVLDAHNQQGRVFDEDRLHGVMRQSVGRSAGQLIDAIIAAVDQFTGGTPQTDDLTLFVIKRL
ncbi:MAG: PP2C family protein-serine/threonine phosphatase, partial [Anaerolineae bacterium]|nr:PP2C family protein-serine/threonine phosphatase [Anaerolineae bacterium]